MKRLVFVTGIILIACTAVSAIFTPVALADENDTALCLDSSSVGSQTYILKDFNGRLAVFKKGESAPFKITDTLTSSLAKGDFMSLRGGIEVCGDTQLQKALEDFCS